MEREFLRRLKWNVHVSCAHQSAIHPSVSVIASCTRLTQLPFPPQVTRTTYTECYFELRALGQDIHADMAARVLPLTEDELSALEVGISKGAELLTRTERELAKQTGAKTGPASYRPLRQGLPEPERGE